MVQQRYRLGTEIGRGALGYVVHVHDLETDQLFAGKILHASHQSDAEARERFASEAAILSDVQDANIVRVYGLECIENKNVMRMEYVAGDDLATLLALEGPLGEERTVAIAAQLASGLRAAHLAGLVHRDLKPQNVLMAASENPKIADFGMARAASFAGVDASAFAVAGTPDYMAPECLDPLAVDARSDLYALGCILFEMIMGAPPFSAATSFAVLEAHRKADVPPIDRTDISPALVALIHSLLEKSAVDRPQSAAAVVERLHDIANGDVQGLALQGSTGLAGSGLCASCGQSLLGEVAACFACGASTVTLQEGPYSLFVTGPGQLGDKLDSLLRQKLLDWLQANPALHLDPAPLAKKVPRVPFVVLTGVSQGSATELANALEELGLRCQVNRGGAYALAQMRKKSWIMSRRVAMVGVGSWVWAINSLGSLVLPILGVGLVAGVAAGWHLAGRSVTERSGEAVRQLPLRVAGSLAGVAIVVQDMQLRRHRDNLRGVVERVLSLCDRLPPAQLSESEADLARLLDVALIACRRMDEIEVTIAEDDMRNPSPATLDLMRERDRWAGRVLEVTAFLETLRTRMAALKHAGPSQLAKEKLSELSDHIAALEEIAAL